MVMLNSQKELELKTEFYRPWDIGSLKTVMNEAVDLGYTTNIQFRHKKFSFAGVETDAVHLTEKEIARLYRFDCSAKKRLEQVRDLFVYGCFSVASGLLGRRHITHTSAIGLG